MSLGYWYVNVKIACSPVWVNLCPSQPQIPVLGRQEWTLMWSFAVVMRCTFCGSLSYYALPVSSNQLVFSPDLSHQTDPTLTLFLAEMHRWHFPPTHPVNMNKLLISCAIWSTVLLIGKLHICEGAQVFLINRTVSVLHNIQYLFNICSIQMNPKYLNI